MHFKLNSKKIKYINALNAMIIISSILMQIFFCFPQNAYAAESNFNNQFLYSFDFGLGKYVMIVDESSNDYKILNTYCTGFDYTVVDERKLYESLNDKAGNLSQDTSDRLSRLFEMLDFHANGKENIYIFILDMIFRHEYELNNTKSRTDEMQAKITLCQWALDYLTKLVIDRCQYIYQLRDVTNSYIDDITNLQMYMTNDINFIAEEESGYFHYPDFDSTSYKDSDDELNITYLADENYSLDMGKWSYLFYDRIGDFCYESSENKYEHVFDMLFGDLEKWKQVHNNNISGKAEMLYTFTDSAFIKFLNEKTDLFKRNTENEYFKKYSLSSLLSEEYIKTGTEYSYKINTDTGIVTVKDEEKNEDVFSFGYVYYDTVMPIENVTLTTSKLNLQNTNEVSVDSIYLINKEAENALFCFPKKSGTDYAEIKNLDTGNDKEEVNYYFAIDEKDKVVIAYFTSYFGMRPDYGDLPNGQVNLSIAFEIDKKILEKFLPNVKNENSTIKMKSYLSDVLIDYTIFCNDGLIKVKFYFPENNIIYWIKFSKNDLSQRTIKYTKSARRFSLSSKIKDISYSLYANVYAIDHDTLDDELIEKFKTQRPEKNIIAFLYKNFSASYFENTGFTFMTEKDESDESEYADETISSYVHYLLPYKIENKIVRWDWSALRDISPSITRNIDKMEYNLGYSDAEQIFLALYNVGGQRESIDDNNYSNDNFIINVDERFIECTFPVTQAYFKMHESDIKSILDSNIGVGTFSYQIENINIQKEKLKEFENKVLGSYAKPIIMFLVFISLLLTSIYTILNSQNAKERAAVKERIRHILIGVVLFSATVIIVDFSSTIIGNIMQNYYDRTTEVNYALINPITFKTDNFILVSIRDTLDVFTNFIKKFIDFFFARLIGPDTSTMNLYNVIYNSGYDSDITMYPFNQYEWYRFMQVYKVIGAISAALLGIAILKISFEMIMTSDSSEKNADEKETIKRVIIAFIGIMSGPYIVRMVLTIFNWLVALMPVKYFHSVLTFGNVGLIGSLANFLYSTVEVKIYFAFTVRKVMLTTMLILTPIMFSIWAISNKFRSLSLWMGELFSNAASQLAYALTFFVILLILGVNQNEYIILILTLMMMKLADFFKDSLQGLVQKGGGINETSVAEQVFNAGKDLAKNQIYDKAIKQDSQKVGSALTNTANFIDPYHLSKAGSGLGNVGTLFSNIGNIAGGNFDRLKTGDTDRSRYNRVEEFYRNKNRNELENKTPEKQRERILNNIRAEKAIANKKNAVSHFGRNKYEEWQMTELADRIDTISNEIHEKKKKDYMYISPEIGTIMALESVANAQGQTDEIAKCNNSSTEAKVQMFEKVLQEVMETFRQGERDENLKSILEKVSPQISAEIKEAYQRLNMSLEDFNSDNETSKKVFEMLSVLYGKETDVANLQKALKSAKEHFYNNKGFSDDDKEKMENLEKDFKEYEGRLNKLFLLTFDANSSKAIIKNESNSNDILKKYEEAKKYFNFAANANTPEEFSENLEKAKKNIEELKEKIKDEQKTKSDDKKQIEETETGKTVSNYSTARINRIIEEIYKRKNSNSDLSKMLGITLNNMYKGKVEKAIERYTKNAYKNGQKIIGKK